jgi:RecA/RadA recombinase
MLTLVVAAAVCTYVFAQLDSQGSGAAAQEDEFVVGLGDNSEEEEELDLAFASDAPLDWNAYEKRLESAHAEDFLGLKIDRPPSIRQVLQDYSRARAAESAQSDVDESTEVGCHMSDSESCPISDMVAEQVNNVFPGGVTRCLLSTKPVYSFQVIPGASDKLMIYFQGGGACWDQASTLAGGCSRYVMEQPSCGLFDRSNADNPFREYTVVHIGYCTGDAHAGNVDRPSWRGPGGATVEQRGYRNARAAVDWAYANFGKVTLDSFVITGCSAGSMGAQLWSSRLLKSFRYENAAVIADSYAGIFPPGIQGNFIKDAGVCDTDLLESQMDKCLNEEMSVQDAFVNAMREYPDVVFASLNSKTDQVQMAFYSAIHLTWKRSPSVLSPAGFYRKLSAVESFYAQQPNFVIFDLNSPNHCYTNQKYFYSADARGASFKGFPLAFRFPWQKPKESAPPVEQLPAWLARFPVPRGGSVASECKGKRGSGSSWTGWEWCNLEASSAVFRRPSSRVNSIFR